MTRLEPPPSPTPPCFRARASRRGASAGAIGAYIVALLFLPPRSSLAGETISLAVDAKDDLSHADLAKLATDYGLTLTPNSDWSEGHDNLEIAEVDVSEKDRLLDRLSHDPRVEIAEPLSTMEAYFVPNDPLFSEKQWHLQRVGAERAWDFACGRGVTVAVIDTGIACFDDGPFSRGTDLTGTRCKGGYDFVKRSGTAADDNGHGTHVAGTIAQTTHNGKGAAGLAFCAELMPIKVLAATGSGRTTDVAEGIRYAADNGAEVINLSLGGSFPSRVLASAIDHAIENGVVVVAAAGNSGTSVGYPAAYPGVLAVSATGRNDRVAWFSSRGKEIVLAAPGVEVTQQTVCDGGKNHCEIFGTLNGTSMASPHVAGAAAMLIGLGVTDPASVRHVLERTAVAKDDASLYGAGILDVARATESSFTAKLFGRLGALAALVLALYRWIKKRRGTFAFGPLAVGSALFAGVGLAPFLPFVRATSGIPSLRAPLELAARPFAEWDLAMTADAHRFLPLANAAPGLALFLLLFGVGRLRPALGGFAVGTAAYLVHLALVADAHFVFGALALRLFTVLNAAVLMVLARLALDVKRSG